jgi:hypothetical protein
MKFLSYDIEIYETIGEGEEVDYHKIHPSVAATCTTENDVKYYYDYPYMSKETAQRLVKDIQSHQLLGYVPFGWNSCSFDFRLLAYHSGMIEECAEIALNHVDGMLLITFNKGFYLGLDTSLVGAGLETKLHKVNLNDGSLLEGMSGKLAPELWRKGEYQAVKDYLRLDVIQPLKLCFAIEKNRGIQWTSKSGRPMYQKTDMVLVKDLFKIPAPDTSWMQSSPTRKQFVDWMPKSTLDKYGIRV